LAVQPETERDIEPKDYLFQTIIDIANNPNGDNNPPCAPLIDGPDMGRPGKEYEYVFINADVDDNQSFIWIDWGDNNSTGWLGPFENYRPLKFNHSWNKTGTYEIKAKAKDIHGAESYCWSYLEVTIPRTRTSSYHWLFERFPMLERLLNIIK